MKKLAGVTVSAAAGAALLLGGATPAEAGSNFGTAVNRSGSPVRIDCDYKKGPYYVVYERARTRKNYSWAYCSDTDRIQSAGDTRCIYYHGPGVRDGWYRLQGNVWRKILGASLVEVYAYTNARCGGKPWYNRT